MISNPPINDEVSGTAVRAIHERRIHSVVCDRWRIDRLLGIGGMAAVFSASEPDGRRAALKILHRESIVDAAVVRRFRKEAYAANRIQHPAVVRIAADVVCDDGCPVLVMELVEGSSVDALLRRSGGTLPRAQIFSIADQLMSVVAAAHRYGVLHRDIKPSNLMLDRSGTLRILDFGIARIICEGNKTEYTREALLGTPEYMSPEQARGRWELVDATSDVYSIGATVFKLATGRPVHVAGTRNEQLGMAMTTQAPRLHCFGSELSEGACEVIDRALEYDKTLRWPDVDAMQAEWRRRFEEGNHQRRRRPIMRPDRLDSVRDLGGQPNRVTTTRTSDASTTASSLLAAYARTSRQHRRHGSDLLMLVTLTICCARADWYAIANRDQRLHSTATSASKTSMLIVSSLKRRDSSQKLGSPGSRVTPHETAQREVSEDLRTRARGNAIHSSKMPTFEVASMSASVALERASAALGPIIERRDELDVRTFENADSASKTSSALLDWR